MVYVKTYFVKITSLDKISNDKVYLSLYKNFKNSSIKLISAEKVLIR